jgi:hypothetical protein
MRTILLKEEGFMGTLAEAQQTIYTLGFLCVVLFLAIFVAMEIVHRVMKGQVKDYVNYKLGDWLSCIFMPWRDTQWEAKLHYMDVTDLEIPSEISQQIPARLQGKVTIRKMGEGIDVEIEAAGIKIKLNSPSIITDLKVLS